MPGDTTGQAAESALPQTLEVEPCPDAARTAAPTVWRFIVPVALAVLVAIVFVPALDATFVDWDDDDLLFYNTRYRTLSADSLRWMFTTSFAGHFQPLTWLSYSLDWVLWKHELFGYHLTSVVLHALTAVGLYFLARRLLTADSGDNSAIMSTPVVLSAGFAATLFAVHPLRAESVAWLAERRDVLGGLFYVLAVGCYLRYAGAAHGRRALESVSSGRYWYVAAVASCTLSLLAKASAVTLPLVLVILDVYPLRRWGRGRNRRSGAGRGTVIDKLPFFVLAVAAGWRAIIAQEEGGALYSFAQHHIWARLAQASYGLMFYLWKTLWPTNLGPIYEIPPRGVLFGPMLWISLVVLATIGFTAMRTRRRLPAIPAALAVYVVVLFPVLGFAQSGPQLVADRYSYLSCMGLAVLAGAGLLRLLQTEARRRNRNRRAILSLAAALVLAALARATYAQAGVWLSAGVLWAHGVRVSPNSAVAHTNYADALVRTDVLFTDAARHYHRALELNPFDPVALHHLADLFRRVGEIDDAIRYYLRALQVDPNRKEACFSLARLLTGTDRPQQAVEVLRDGATRHPEALDLVDYLAQLLSTHRDENVRNGEEAVKWATHVSRAHNDANPKSLLTLATAYAEAGRFDEAADTARRALELAERNGDDRLSSELQRRLTLFHQGRPYHFTE
ncbi:MAG: tetratricopeptide repeat protein [Phycisphaerales bacterium]|nr:MAG: tetratricopeptide repeat protein [Phycisphaerales bacterium]